MAWREPTVRLAIVRKALTEQRENAKAMRRLKMPVLEVGFFSIRVLLVPMRGRFWLFTGVLPGIRREVTWKVKNVKSLKRGQTAHGADTRRVVTGPLKRGSKQKITKGTKILFCPH